MSGARFEQDLINVRDRLNQLENHRHDALYEPKGLVIGKNLIINGDMTEWERGDNVSADNVYAADRWFKGIGLFNKSGISPDGFDYSAYVQGQSGGKPFMKYGVELAEAGKAGKFYQGQQVTFSAYVQGVVGSDILLTLRFRDVVNSATNTVIISSDVIDTVNTTNVWQKVEHTVTIKVDPGATNILLEITLQVDIADSVARFTGLQFELGSKATKFGYVGQAVNKLNCKRYYQRFTLPHMRRHYSSGAWSSMFAGSMALGGMRSVGVPAIITAPTYENCSAILISNTVDVATLNVTATAAGNYGINGGVYEVDAEL